MKKYEDLYDVAQYLIDIDLFNPNNGQDTVENLVDGLIKIGNTDKVYAFHDDHLGLKSSLSYDFLNSNLRDIDKPQFEAEKEEVLEQANTIISLYERHLSEDQLEDIDEDKIYSGLGIDE